MEVTCPRKTPRSVEGVVVLVHDLTERERERERGSGGC